ncbi:MAG: ATP-binding cassette domain-containing protein [Bauldia sp.]|nr:ATP-binding cassette domain-containing protein [Bauldia sp.]
MSALLAATGVHHGYRQKAVLRDVSLTVSAGEFVAIIGPNGSGKSTLLRCLGRLLRPNAGTVSFSGEAIFDIDPRTFARRVAFVPQGPLAPPDLVVEELVWRGRFPHRGLFGRRLGHDRAMVERAMVLADIVHLRGHAMGTLSGGERQRAFIALALAQEPSLVLLDEPTTFLDIAHQLDLLALLARLNREEGLTVVAVMHDLGQAAFFASRLVALRDGMVAADGAPRYVVTERAVAAIFGPGLRVTPDPVTGLPLVLPAAPPLPVEAPAKPARRRTAQPKLQAESRRGSAAPAATTEESLEADVSVASRKSPAPRRRKPRSEAHKPTQPQ